jgi:Tfp pilus assembly protein PilP
MRRHTIWLVTMLLFAFVAGAHAQTDALDTLKKQVQQLQDQLKAAMEQIKAIEAKQATPATPAAPAAPAAPKWYDKVRVSAYWQSRYEAREDTIDGFIMRRMYLSFIGSLNEKTQALLILSRVPAGTEPNIELDAAQVNYRFADDWSTTFGMVYNYFGWDTWESSSKRLPFDRWAAGEGVAGRTGRPGLRGLYALGPMDEGVYVTHHARKDSEPTIHLGVMNGNYNRGDNDDNKVLSLDVRVKRQSGMQYGLSWMDGDFTEVPPGSAAGTPAVTNPRKALGLYFHTEPKPWGVQAEYMDGEFFGNDIRGWYGQVAYNRGGTSKGTPYVRYEEFDPHQGMDTANNQQTYTSLRLGYAYQLDNHNELTLELQDAEQGSVDYGQLGLQWQLGW